jgi:hypothetical protein
VNIEVTIKSVYGLPRIYPANEAAQALADIAGTKTLEPRTIKRAISGLGANVQIRGADDAAQLAKMLEAA